MVPKWNRILEQWWMNFSAQEYWDFAMISLYNAYILLRYYFNIMKLMLRFGFNIVDYYSLIIIVNNLSPLSDNTDSTLLLQISFLIIAKILPRLLTSYCHNIATALERYTWNITTMFFKIVTLSKILFLIIKKILYQHYRNIDKIFFQYCHVVLLTFNHNCNFFSQYSLSIAVILLYFCHDINIILPLPCLNIVSIFFECCFTTQYDYNFAKYCLIIESVLP